MFKRLMRLLLLVSCASVLVGVAAFVRMILLIHKGREVEGPLNIFLYTYMTCFLCASVGMLLNAFLRHRP